MINKFAALQNDDDDEDWPTCQRSASVQALEASARLTPKKSKDNDNIEALITKRKWTPVKRGKDGEMLVGALLSEDIVIHGVETNNGRDWKGLRHVEILVDSGAAENVANPRDLPEFPILESQGSKRGLNYVTADGGRIPNLGEQRVRVMTHEGARCGLTFQSADVTRPILSVTKVSEMGHNVEFTKTGGCIRNIKTNQATRFVRRQGVYVLDVWLDGSSEKSRTPGFPRPGR
jgi:hypothetical protein